MSALKYFLSREVEFGEGSTWYTPKNWLQSCKDVIRADYIDTTSSAGDWCGYVAIKEDDEIALISFEQYNNWPSGNGFTLEIDNTVFAFVSDASDIDDAVRGYIERDF